MKKHSLKIVSVLFFLLFSVFNGQANNESKSDPDKIVNLSTNEQQFIATMQKHLNAISNRDLESLSSTLSPSGQMQLILPGTEIIEGIDGFLAFHEEWFEDKSWTMATKIVSTEIGKTIGLAVTEAIYKEPLRNGKPYFNRMSVTYVLRKEAGKWYVIKDHCSSIEKVSSEETADDLREKYHADEYGMKKYVIAFLKTGPNRDLDQEAANALQAAHMENIGKMAEAGQLVLAGPFLTQGDLRGIYVFNVETIEEAKELTNSDPAIQAGSLIMELKEWYGSAAVMSINELHKKMTEE